MLTIVRISSSVTSSSLLQSPTQRTAAGDGVTVADAVAPFVADGVLVDVGVGVGVQVDVGVTVAVGVDVWV
jgi:hypothetical protein